MSDFSGKNVWLVQTEAAQPLLSKSTIQSKSNTPFIFYAHILLQICTLNKHHSFTNVYHKKLLHILFLLFCSILNFIFVKSSSFHHYKRDQIPMYSAPSSRTRHRLLFPHIKDFSDGDTFQYGFLVSLTPSAYIIRVPGTARAEKS